MSDIRVLLVDDEDDFRAPIAMILASQGMDVCQADSAEAMDYVLQSYQPDVIVLDVNLPGENGFEAARRLKQKNSSKIIMLTAYGALEDRLQGLSSGVDYYLPKPVDSRELLLIIRNLAGRQQQSIQLPPEVPVLHQEAPLTIPAGEQVWLLNLPEWQIIMPQKTTQNLNLSELKLLLKLAKTPGTAISRKELYAALGFKQYAPETRSLDVMVSRLRRRCKADGQEMPIKTVHSIGYSFNGAIEIIGSSALAEEVEAM
ncbi:response regulator transcription factor [Thalassolituus alkanivorans]|uniref:response regulator transcription factor n=1 Tax=Thalassolituus alkanivorans TaxID=2881055 RepID=UPI001E44D999|nr:response regulator transcription factor [Thalassolituus alkanivorans]MCB2385598.1 response regulator transcription factor [Thalassolituus alkanivorans]MCB2421532.1 response regulator transcription factor [Thalassolituus alkanivorans]